MLAAHGALRIPLPRGWSRRVKAAMLHVISLARYAVLSARGWAAEHGRSKVRRAAERDQFMEEIGLLREEMRIKDARIARIDPRRRPHYSGIERMAILELKSARGWSQAEAARRFFVEPATIVNVQCFAVSCGRKNEERGATTPIMISETDSQVKLSLKS